MVDKPESIYRQLSYNKGLTWSKFGGIMMPNACWEVARGACTFLVCDLYHIFEVLETAFFLSQNS